MGVSGDGAGWRELARLYAPVVLLHVACVAIFAAYGSRFPVLAGLAATAYLFGLRHAFDADHIAAVDDTVRYMAQRGRNPLAGALVLARRPFDRGAGGRNRRGLLRALSARHRCAQFPRPPSPRERLAEKIGAWTTATRTSTRCWTSTAS